MSYCTISDVKDKTVDVIITSAGWSDTDVQNRIDEGAEIIDTNLIPLGYSQADLNTAPLIKRLNVLYARYAIYRDIYARTQPSKTDEAGFVKWKDEFYELLEKIKAMQMLLIDVNGAIIKPNNVSMTIVPVINTGDVKRIFNLTDSKTWKIKELTYSDDDVIGEQ
jgi:hypothetical protein